MWVPILVPVADLWLMYNGANYIVNHAFASDLERSVLVSFGLWLLSLVGSSSSASRLLLRTNLSAYIWFFVDMAARFENFLH